MFYREIKMLGKNAMTNAYFAKVLKISRVDPMEYESIGVCPFKVFVSIHCESSASARDGWLAYRDKVKSGLIKLRDLPDEALRLYFPLGDNYGIIPPQLARLVDSPHWGSNTGFCFDHFRRVVEGHENGASEEEMEAIYVSQPKEFRWDDRLPGPEKF